MPFFFPRKKWDSKHSTEQWMGLVNQPRIMHRRESLLSITYQLLVAVLYESQALARYVEKSEFQWNGRRKAKRSKQVTFECARFYFLFDLMISVSLIRSPAVCKPWPCSVHFEWIRLDQSTKVHSFLAHLIQRTWCHNDSPQLANGDWSCWFLSLIYFRDMSRVLSRTLWTRRLYLGFVLLGQIFYYF